MGALRRNGVLLAGVAMCCLSASAGTSGGIAEFIAPLQMVFDWATGSIGQILVGLAIVGFGAYLMQSRNEEKGSKLFYLLVGGACILGAQNLVSELGFVGAVY